MVLAIYVYMCVCECVLRGIVGMESYVKWDPVMIL